MEYIQPQRQRVWKWPAATNFSLGGIGTGFYLVGLLLTLPREGNWLASLLSGGDWLQLFIASGVLRLLGPALVGVGFVALTTEAGRPRRGINLFRHLRRSWMSRETLAFALLVPFAGLDWLFPNLALRTLAASAALFLMICQGFIVYRARGVTAWNHPLMPLLFASCGFATGTGCLLAVVPLLNALWNESVQPVATLLLVAAISALLNLIVWFIFLRTPDPAFQKATAVFRGANSLMQVVGIGHLLPLLLLTFALSTHASSLPQSALAVASGLALLFGGIRQKFGLVLDAGYLRAIALPMPRRRAPTTQSVGSEP